MSAVIKPDDECLAPMTTADLDEVARVEAQVYSFPWTLGNFVDSLHAGYSAWTLRHSATNQLIAYAVVMIALDEAHLLNLSVARDFQRQGYGWRMLDWMAQHVRNYGARHMLLEVRPSNRPAQQLYERYGFERIGVRRGYYPAINGREDAVVMRILL